MPMLSQVKKLYVNVSCGLVLNRGKNKETKEKYFSNYMHRLRPCPLAKRYATALVANAAEGNMQAALLTDVQAMQAALVQIENVADFLNNPLSSDSHKEKILIKAFAAISPIGQGVVYFLAEKSRLTLLLGVLSHIETLLEMRAGVQSALVKTASKLSAAQLSALKKVIAKQLPQAKSIQLTQHTDARLIGGFEVYYGTYKLDTSLSGKLNRLKAHLNNA